MKPTGLLDHGGGRQVYLSSTFVWMGTPEIQSNYLLATECAGQIAANPMRTRVPPELFSNGFIDGITPANTG
jgi:hypothetical protein